MNGDWAAQNLQTIRTLMERTALYRRALAPVMIAVGCIGLTAAILGWKLGIAQPGHFIGYWLAVAFIAAGAGFALVRRQAVQAGEPVWSPPARRVVQSALPALGAGLLLAVAVMLEAPVKASQFPGLEDILAMKWLPQGWVILYGCAVHAAGFILPRGMKLFGWAFVVAGSLLFLAGTPSLSPAGYGHALMGFFFGLLHQAYGVYLFLTEKKDPAA